MDFLHNLLNAEALLQSFGPWALAGIAVVVFIESGVLFPFLPGDSLLVTAAILASNLGITPWEIWAVAFIAAFAGDQVGYHIGHSFGPRFFKPDARILRTEHPRCLTSSCPRNLLHASGRNAREMGPWGRGPVA